jgi:Fasciclin domain
MPAGIQIIPEICATLDFGGSISIGSDGALCDPNVFETAKRYDDLSTFVKLVEIADLTEIFMCAGPLTLLAPDNAAFDALDPSTVQELLLPANKEKLQDLLLYTVLPGLHLSEDLEEGTYKTLLMNQTVAVTLDPIMFNQAGVVEMDIIACNGAIYIIKDVLVPGFIARKFLNSGPCSFSFTCLPAASVFCFLSNDSTELSSTHSIGCPSNRITDSDDSTQLSAIHTISYSSDRITDDYFTDCSACPHFKLYAYRILRCRGSMHRESA